MTKILLVILICISHLYCKKNTYSENSITTNNEQNTVTVLNTPPNCAKELDIVINDSIVDWWTQIIQNHQYENDCQQLDIIENAEHKIEIMADLLRVYIGSANGDIFELVWDGNFYELGGVNYVKLFFNETYVSPEPAGRKGTYCFNLSKLKNERKNNYKINIELIAECGYYTKNIIYEP